MGIASEPARRILTTSTLLRLMLAEPGEQPWFASSRERQEFGLLMLTHLGTRLAARIVQLAGMSQQQAASPQDQWGVGQAVDAVLAAAQQLSRPPLPQLLAVAAPAMVAAAEAVGAISVDACSCPPAARGYGWAPAALQPQHVKLLADLALQLDPLALGLALPGCYNPACTCLAGACESDMKLKRCTGCKIAR